MTTSRRIALAALLALAVVAVFQRSLAAPFISLDDPGYVTGNSMVRLGLTLRGIWWAIAGIHYVNWSPLTWLSLMLDSELFGLDPWGYHFTNLLLHVAATMLFFWLLQSSTHCVGRSLFAALLFGVHPLHVEPVVWISSRKDVLSGALAMLTVLFYLRQHRCHRERARRWSGPLVSASFALALLAKSYVATLPVLLLLLDYWPLGRWRRAGAADTDGASCFRARALLVEKVPLFVLGFAVAAINVHAQGLVGRDINAGYLALGTRLGNAFVFLASYIGKAFWPSALAVEYPHPLASLPISVVVACAIGIALLCAGALRMARSRPYVFVGWLWFVCSIAPALQIRQMGNQGMADRFMYLPIAGLCIIASWALGDGLAAVLRRAPSRLRPIAIVALAAGIVLALGIASHRQLRHWRSSVAVFEHAIRVTGGSGWAFASLAHSQLAAGRPGEAEAAYRQALKRDPVFSYAFKALGLLLQKDGRIEELMRYVRPLYGWRSASYSEHIEAGNILYAMRRSRKLRALYASETGRLPVEDIIRHWEAAIDLLPDVEKSFDMRASVAELHRIRGDEARAAELAEQVLAHDADDLSAHVTLAACLLKWGELERARGQAHEALRIEPENVSAVVLLRRIEQRKRLGGERSGRSPKKSP